MSAALATGLAAKVVDDLSATALLQSPGSQELFGYKASLDSNLAESK